MPLEKPNVPIYESADSDLGFFKLKTILDEANIKPVRTENEQIDETRITTEHFIDPIGNTVIIKTKHLKDGNKEMIFEIINKDNKRIAWENATRNLNRIRGYINPQEDQDDKHVFNEIITKLKSRLPSKATSETPGDKIINKIFYELLDGEIIFTATSNKKSSSTSITIKDESGKIIFFEERN